MIIILSGVITINMTCSDGNKAWIDQMSIRTTISNKSKKLSKIENSARFMISKTRLWIQNQNYQQVRLILDRWRTSNSDKGNTKIKLFRNHRATLTSKPNISRAKVKPLITSNTLTQNTRVNKISSLLEEISTEYRREFNKLHIHIRTQK